MKTQEKIICNCCKKVILERNGIPKAEYLHVEKQWGYFSGKDGEKQEFDLCEECYDMWIGSFQIPINTQEVTELI